MMCPKCNSKSKVINSRPSNYGIYRRRQCLECGHRFSTQEVLSLNVEEASRKMGRLKLLLVKEGKGYRDKGATVKWHFGAESWFPIKGYT